MLDVKSRSEGTARAADATIDDRDRARWRIPIVPVLITLGTVAVAAVLGAIAAGSIVLIIVAVISQHRARRVRACVELLLQARRPLRRREEWPRQIG